MRTSAHSYILRRLGPWLCGCCGNYKRGGIRGAEMVRRHIERKHPRKYASSDWAIVRK